MLHHGTSSPAETSGLGLRRGASCWSTITGINRNARGTVVAILSMYEGKCVFAVHMDLRSGQSHAHVAILLAAPGTASERQN